MESSKSFTELHLVNPNSREILENSLEIFKDFLKDSSVHVFATLTTRSGQQR